MFASASCGSFRKGYESASIAGQEEELRQSLKFLRQALHDYKQREGRLPTDLENLVSGGYIRKIPNDPTTGRPDWKILLEHDANGHKGISDVRSSSQTTANDGSRYSDW